MHLWYSSKARHLGLAAENGFVWRWDSVDKSEQDWKFLNEDVELEWMNQVKMIMQQYVNKTEGSFIEEKQSSIIWNYKNTDIDFGTLQAKELNQ